MQGIQPQAQSAQKGVLLRGADPSQGMVGRTGRIDATAIKKAAETLLEYKRCKANLEQRIVSNEQWYKLQHWDLIRHRDNTKDPEPASAWLLNCIANKHADAMDNFPEPNVLPREEGDKSEAEMLTSILPVVLEQNEFEQTYSDMWWRKLKTGTCVPGVLWNPAKNNGLGDIEIRDVDILNLYWQPGIRDIQKSRNLFHVDMVDRETLEEQYPDVKGNLGVGTLEPKKYVYDDTVPTEDKVAVVDWYYKLSVGGKTILHYCKFVGDTVLYASENDPQYAERGFYDHGKYPFVFDVLFPEEGTPAGFGYVDICKSPQLYIDKLDQSILRHAVMRARPRYFIKGDGQINEDEYADWSRDFVHYVGNGNPKENITPVEVPDISDSVVTIRSLKIDELKETSGNRDFSQGGTSSGVTAASAIAALQEAGSKLSRDMIKSSYRTFAQINYLCIELIRQFYTEARSFRITGKQGDIRFAQYDNRNIAPAQQGSDFGLDLGIRIPMFDISVKPQKSSPFSTVVQNERAKELYGLGFFRPDLADQSLAALEMMQFEGIEAVRQRVAMNQTLFQQLQQIQPLLIAMAAELDAIKGTQYTAQVQQLVGMQMQQTPQGAAQPEMQANALGNAFQSTRTATAGGAREKAASASTPKV